MLKFNCFARVITLFSILFFSAAHAGMPLWSFEPLTATTFSLSPNNTATVQYKVTNNSSKPHTLSMKPQQAVTQVTVGAGICANPFLLQGNSSCVLSLQINGANLTAPIVDAPIVCQQNSSLQCYRPAPADILRVTPVSAAGAANISVAGSPLTLTVNGSSGFLTVTNNSSTITATNITSNFSGTALDGNVTETGNTCASVAPGASCTLTYTPGNFVVSLTSFPVSGDNTNTTTEAMRIDSGSTLISVSPSTGAASGGVGVTLTGTGLTGATSVTFDGVAATSVHVVSSTIVTAVTPAHAIGAVDVVIATPGGGATLPNGFTYQITAIGQPAFGGVIACLGGALQNFVAAAADNSVGIPWGGSGITTSASSDTDGEDNTTKIVIAVGTNGGVPYAAQLCDNFQVDSQGNTPCQGGNTCYSNWFLPSRDQLNCLYNNRTAVGNFSVDTYWSSTESSSFPSLSGLTQLFLNGAQGTQGKGFSSSVRCVRVVVP